MKQKMHTLLVDVLKLENIRKVARLDRMQPFLFSQVTLCYFSGCCGTEITRKVANSIKYVLSNVIITK